MKDLVDYEMHDVYCELLSFYLVILELPEEDIEDKLVHFAKDEGLISKVLFEDYLLANYVVNISQVLVKLTEDSISEDFNFLDLRTQMVNIVLEKNPSLNYDKLVINKNKVLKIKSRCKNIEETTPLCDNPLWLYNPPTQMPDGQDLTNIIENVNLIDGFEEEAGNSIIQMDDSSSYDKKDKWWKRIGRYVSVKVFKEADLATILKGRFFHSSVSFNTFVVTLCIEDFEALFQLLENMGVPARVSPPLLMKELYDLCQVCNPFLTYEKAQELSNQDIKPTTGSCTDCGTGKKSASSGTTTMEQFANKVDKKKKVFADVPPEDLLNLATNMKVSLIGQDKVVDSLTEAIQRASVGLKDPVKPIGSFLFAGSTGCGKSLAGKILADELVKDRDNLITIDCSEYSADHEYSKLIGSPNGYQGYENGGLLTNAIIEHPFSVVVFDEIEKASSKIYQLLLQVLEEGRLTDNKGTKVSFKDTVIILTSNVGVENIANIGKTIGFGDVAVVTEDKKEKAIEKALKQKFKPEFLNRLDEIIYFNNLTQEDYYRIIDIELFKLNTNLQINKTKYKDIEIIFDKKVCQFIYNKGITKEYGARPLKRAIEKYISTPLAVQLLKGITDFSTVVTVSTSKGEVIFKFSKRPVRAPKCLDASGKVGK
jgi:hypothetical protein